MGCCSNNCCGRNNSNGGPNIICFSCGGGYYGGGYGCTQTCFSPYGMNCYRPTCYYISSGYSRRRGGCCGCCGGH